MIEDEMFEGELRATFARHEHLAPSVESLRSRLAAATRRRRRALRATLGSATVALAAVLVVALPFWFGGWRGEPAHDRAHTAAAPPSAARNILLIGDDGRPGLDGARADTVILLHLPRDGRSAYLISIPRDTWVDGACPAGSDRQQVTCPYLTGGASALAATVTRFTGVPLDGVVTVRFAGLVRIVDAIGGVDVYVDLHTDATVHDAMTGRDYHRGETHFTGAEALDYARVRHAFGGADVDRQQRVQQLLTAVFTKAAGGLLSDPARLRSLLAAADGALRVDLHGADPITVLGQYAGLRPAAVTGVLSPGTPSQQDGRILPDPSATQLYEAVRGDDLAAYLDAHRGLVWDVTPH